LPYWFNIGTDEANQSGISVAETDRKVRNAAEVVAALRRDIADSKYLPNERLPAERDLSDAFGVARGTLREALRQLEEMAYVERRAGSGTYVIYSDDAAPKVTETTRPLELVDARFALEPHICRLAVLHATDRDFVQLDQVMQRMETWDGDVAAFAEADETFHMMLAEITRNPMLIWMMQKVADVRTHAQWAQMRSLTLTAEMIDGYNREHRAICNAIRAREPERAAQAMKDHLSAARDSLMKAAQT